jgi:hypothetical protein
LLCDGGAVVTDFGIAKALKASLPSGDAPTSTLTERGLVLGTPLYMAPEQAAGEAKTDDRADLYSLGVVAYEMLAGRPPFEGRSAQQIMAAHAAQQPRPVGELRSSTPAWLATLVMQCLEKRPADRPRDAQEVLRLLETASVSNTTWRLPGLRVSATIAALLLSVLIIALAAFELRRDKPAIAPTWLDLDAPDSASARSWGWAPINLSPDGSQIAYVGGPRNSLFVRSLGDRRGPRKIEYSDNARCPSFSPDGQSIVFTTNYQLVKVAVSGGTPTAVVDSTVNQCALWIGERRILFGRRASFFTVSSDGGPQSLVARIDTLNDIYQLQLSQALPGGKAVLVFFVATSLPTNWELGVLSLTDGKVTRLRRNGVTPRYADGYLLYTSCVLQDPRHNWFPRTRRLRRLQTAGWRIWTTAAEVLAF